MCLFSPQHHQIPTIYIHYLFPHSPSFRNLLNSCDLPCIPFTFQVTTFHIALLSPDRLTNIDFLCHWWLWSLETILSSKRRNKLTELPDLISEVHATFLGSGLESTGSFYFIWLICQKYKQSCFTPSIHTLPTKQYTVAYIWQKRYLLVVLD